MNFAQLRAFLTVADTGNVTRAADILHLVQPAVSRQLRLLEEDIGASLFERERHGMVLTEAGQALLPHARRAMAELERARMEIDAAASTEVRGPVALGMLPSTVDLIAGRLVSTLADNYPAIRLRLSVGYAGTLLDWLESGEVDAALLYGPARSPNIQTTPLVEEPLWVVAPASAKLCRDTPIPLAALAGRKIVLPGAPHGIRTLVDHACAVAEISLDVVAETNALNVQRALTLSGHGLTILPPSAFAEDLHAKRLSAAPLVEPALSRTIVLGLPSHRPTSRHVRCSLERLMHEMRVAIESSLWPAGRWLAE